ncbi:hypothetical protein DHD80_01595 [Gramella sp. AN32]|nr:hypothetical protein [Gramella sp. AN32]
MILYNQALFNSRTCQCQFRIC